MLRVIFINSNPERNFLVKRLFPQNWKVRYTAGVSDSIGWLRKEDFDCVLCDFYREEKSNTFFFEILNNTNIPVFIWPTKKISQNEFKILKTELRNCYFFNNSDTFETVKTEIISHTFENEKKHCFFDNLISISPAMEELKKRIVKYAGNDFPVLIYGESGTGKELVARAVHNLSSRGDNIFTAVNMSSIPEQLAESEFFGVIKGAYTDACQRKGLFCSSTGGSIFLDEIETTPIYLQAKLLRAIETKQDITRVSEQELKQIFIEQLNKEIEKGWDVYYSVETPTEKKYRFEGKDKPEQNDSGRSANFDLVIHNNKFERIALIEFKANNPKLNDYLKDLVKLNEENHEGKVLRYFVQIVKNSDKGTENSLQKKMKDNEDIYWCYSLEKGKRINPPEK